MFSARERAVWCVGLGTMAFAMACIGFVSDTIPPDRRPIASVLFGMGLVIAGLAVWWLRRLKQSTDPFVSWRWYLRRELTVVAVMAIFVVIVALLPPEAHEAIHEWSRNLMDALQTVSPGLGPPRMR